MNPARPNSSLIHPRRRAGFTLLELLVVLTVILLLAGSLTAAVARSQQGVHRISCASQLRQWGLATQQYAGDHDDRLPPDGAPNGISREHAWYIDLPRTLGLPTYPESGAWRTNPAVPLPRTWWLCPANRRTSNGNLLFHYALNRRVNGSGAEARTARLSQLAEPSVLIWLFDNGRLAAVAAEGNVHTNLHGQGAHFLLLDGHVERVANQRYWDFRRNRPVSQPAGLRWTP